MIDSHRDCVTNERDAKTGHVDKSNEHVAETVQNNTSSTIVRRPCRPFSTIRNTLFANLIYSRRSSAVKLVYRTTKHENAYRLTSESTWIVQRLCVLTRGKQIETFMKKTFGANGNSIWYECNLSKCLSYVDCKTAVERKAFWGGRLGGLHLVYMISLPSRSLSNTTRRYVLSSFAIFHALFHSAEYTISLPQIR